MAALIWLEKELVLQLHDYVLTETGGANGLRDLGLLESALARPIDRYIYEGITDHRNCRHIRSGNCR